MANVTVLGFHTESPSSSPGNLGLADTGCWPSQYPTGSVRDHWWWAPCGSGHGLWDPEPSSNAGVSEGSGGSGGSGPAEGEDSPGRWDGRTQGKGTSVGRCPSRYPAQGVSCLHWDSERNTIGAKFYELIEE